MLGEARSVLIKKDVQKTSGALAVLRSNGSQTDNFSSTKNKQQVFQEGSRPALILHTLSIDTQYLEPEYLQPISVCCIQLSTDVPLFHAVSVYLIIITRLKIPTKLIDVFKIPCTRFSHKNLIIRYEIKRWKYDAQPPCFFTLYQEL